MQTLTKYARITVQQDSTGGATMEATTERKRPHLITIRGTKGLDRAFTEMSELCRCTKAEMLDTLIKHYRTTVLSSAEEAQRLAEQKLEAIDQALKESDEQLAARIKRGRPAKDKTKANTSAEQMC